MTGEWVERRVADLEVGDDVRDAGTVLASSPCSSNEFWWDVRTSDCASMWPAHARVDIRRPDVVTVCPTFSHYSEVRINGHLISQSMPTVHAEEYAARLRSSAHDRALALGKDTT